MTMRLQTTGPANRANELADVFRDALPKAAVEVSHSSNRVGHSSYVTVTVPGCASMTFRVSDHDKAAHNADFYHHVPAERGYDVEPAINGLREVYDRNVA